MTFFSLVSRLAFTVIFIILLPVIIERINTVQTDIELIRKREKVIKLIENKGLEQFMFSDSVKSFGSYNILKNEFINIEKSDLKENWNFFEVTDRIIEGETIEFRILNYSINVNGKKYLLEIGKSTESIKATEETTKKVILVFLILFISITLLLDLTYTRHLLHPLGLIIKKLKSTASPELFDKQPVNTTTSDFVSLDQTLRELMDKIDELFRREKDITVNISHELLTPISIIRSKLENLLLNESTDSTVRTKIGECMNTLNRLSSLVNSLLMISRIESHQYLKEDSFRIAEMLNELCEEIFPVAENKGTIIRKELAYDFVIADVNRALLFSMFFNVVNNAVKNTSRNGEIIVRTYIENNLNRVSISDNGKGMSRMQMETLFSRFKAKQDGDNEGTGIGLAIAKSIADFHHIKIDASSEPGIGAEFIFSFY
jgi:signal transduction histidine kinase